MSLIHWWPLNGNLNDYGTKNVTLTGNATVNNSGKIGKCYAFNGSNTYLRAEYPNTTKPTSAISLAGWYKATSLNAVHYIVSCYESGGAGLAGGTGNVNFQLYYNGSYYRTIQAVPDTNWHHWCGTFDGRYLKLYMDGVLKQTTDMGSGSHPISYHSTTSWMIGANPYNDSPAGDYTNGYINDVRVYDHALSVKEVRELAKGLVLHYTFEDEYIEATTNLLNSSYSSSTPSTYNSSFQTLIETYHGNPVIRCTGTSSTNSGFRYGVSVNLASGESVTFSLYLRYNGSKTNFSSYHAGSADGSYRDPLVSRGLSTGGTGQSTWVKETVTIYDENRQKVLSWDNVVIGKWYFIETNLTNVFSSQITVSNYYFLGGSNAGTWDIACPQLEKKDHATPYVADSRSVGTVFDSSGLGNNGTQYGNALQIVSDSACGEHSAKFNNTANSAVVCGNGMFVKDEITVNWWGYMDNWANYGRALSCTEGGGWNFEPNSSKMGFPLYLSGIGYKSAVSTTTLANLSAGWHMFTGAYDGYTNKIYIDGVLEGSISSGASSKTPIAYPSNGLFIGAEAAGTATTPTSPYFNGNIADVKIYATALSASDILAEYNRKAAIDRNGNLFTGQFIEQNTNPKIATKQDQVIASDFVEGSDKVKIFDKYTELEYIEGGSGQYIATEHNFNHTNTLEINAKSYISSTGNRGCLASEYSNGSALGIEFISGIRVYNSGNPDFNNAGFVFNSENEYSVRFDRTAQTITSYCRGTTVSKTGLYGNNGVSFYIFVDREKRFSTFNKTHRLYYFEMIKDGALYCRFIPAKRKSDSVIGLFDLVEQKFYTNSGSGSFTAGPELGDLSIICTNQIKEL